MIVTVLWPNGGSPPDHASDVVAASGHPGTRAVGTKTVAVG